MSKRSLVDSIEVKKTCSEDWNAMKGTDRIRFCEHCSLHVHNLSAMTRKQALKLVRKSEGRVCVRYVKNQPDNTPLFAEKLYKITRRAGLAAGVLGASLTFSSLTYAQGEPILTKRNNDLQVEKQNEKKSLENKSEILVGTLSGQMVDPNGAVIPNATLNLTNLETDALRSIVTDNDGRYIFENLEEGKYKIQGISIGFRERSVDAIVRAGKETVVIIDLEVSEMLTTVGVLAVTEYSTPLLQAVAELNLEKVGNLIANGENVNSRDKNYNNITPLFLAVENGDLKSVEMLLNFGAKPNIRDDLGQTPLMRLDEDATPELVQILLKYGAKVNSVDKERNTPLILASRNVLPEVLQVLILNTTDLNAKNRNGRTALMEAADADNLENVRLLVLSGADVYLKDNEGQTAWDLAVNDEIETLLENYGAGKTEN